MLSFVSDKRRWWFTHVKICHNINPPPPGLLPEKVGPLETQQKLFSEQHETISKNSMTRIAPEKTFFFFFFFFFFLNLEDISLEPVQNSSRPDGRSDWTFKGEQQLLIEMYGKIPKSVRGTLLPADQRAKVQHDCLRHMCALFLRCDLKSFLETDPMIDKHR